MIDDHQVLNIFETIKNPFDVNRVSVQCCLEVEGDEENK